MGVRLASRQVRILVLCTTAAWGSIYAQDTNTQSAKTDSFDQYPDLIELDAFGGGSFYGSVVSGLDEKLANGGTAGGRIAGNFSKYVGLELNYNFMINNVRLLTPLRAGLPSFTFGNQLQYVSIDPVFNLRPRGSRVQPYLTLGAGPALFHPTNQAKQYAQLVNGTYGSGALSSDARIAFNYGGGVKFHLSDHFGLRFDVRGFLSRNPTFGLPTSSTTGIYIPDNHPLNGVQATLGIVLYYGQPKPLQPPVCPPPAILPTPTITGGEGTICPGKPVTLHANSQAPAGHNFTYTWTLNGASQTATGPDFTFTPNNSETFTVGVTVSDATPPPAPPVGCPPASAPAPVSATATVTVTESTPTVSITATPTTLSCTQPNPPNQGPFTAQLTADASAGACGTNLTYKWAVSEGSLSNDTSSTTSFDTGTLTFTANEAQPQTKTVSATVTVTDQNGHTATAQTNLTVNCLPMPFVRLDDVIFAKNSARVNNCGKRILIDDVAPQIGSGNYDVVLVGHRTPDERADLAGQTRRSRGRHAKIEGGQPLDEARALNAAAVLTGGSGRCANVDLSRVKVDWVGTDQTSALKPGLCATSNNPAEQKERRGETVAAADEGRRVEVYLVPRGSQTLPPAVKNLKPLPEREVKALGCPR